MSDYEQDHDKYQQAEEISEPISDELLEEFLTLNFAHLGLQRGENQDVDVSLISYYAKKKFMCAIDVLSKINIIPQDRASLLPYVANVVGELSPKIPIIPANFNGKLYAPQAALIKRMIDLEEESYNSKFPLKLHCGMISERLSFGKTYCMPALVCEKFRPCDDHSALPINLVIAGSKVVKEWKNNLKKSIILDFLVVETTKQLKELESGHGYPQILVVKDGEITHNGEKKSAISHVFDVLTKKSNAPLKFARVLYDDFDMLKFKGTFIAPNALFSWFISGTATDPAKFPKISIDYEYLIDGEFQPRTTTIAAIYPILECLASISCNRDFSSIEYNIPMIDIYRSNYDLYEIIASIVGNTISNDGVRLKLESAALIQGIQNAPYVYDKSRMKILCSLENKEDQLALIDSLNQAGIKAVRLTHANISKFEREDSLVGVAGNLFGVNMGFLTHIIVNADDYTSQAQTQIIGRGQRLSRKQNLQVYMRYCVPLGIDDSDDNIQNIS